MHAKEAEIVTGAQTRHDQALFGFGRRRLLDDGFDLVEIGPTRQSSPANRAIIGEETFTRRLHGRHGTRLGLGHFHQLLGAAALAAVDIQVIADQV